MLEYIFFSGFSSITMNLFRTWLKMSILSGKVTVASHSCLFLWKPLQIQKFSCIVTWETIWRKFAARSHSKFFSIQTFDDSHEKWKQ